MTGSGFIVQYSTNYQMGIISAGGTDHASFLRFSLDACSGPIQSQLQQGSIPPNQSIPVTFDVGMDPDGNMIAVNVR